MPPTESLANTLTQLDKIIATLDRTPALCSAGFHAIVDYMGGFSASFASSASRAAAIRERHSVKGKSKGLQPLQQDLTRIQREIESSLKHFDGLMAQTRSFVQTTDSLILWALTLEQDAFLPQMADQIISQGSDALERQTQCAIIDSLMRQIRPLIHDLISSLRDASTMMQQLTQRLAADMDLSSHRLKALKSRLRDVIGRMGVSIAAIDEACQKIESHAEANNGVLFEMMQTMQYDDISVQRLAHITEMMRQGRERLAEAQGQTQPLRWFAMTTRLTIDQLEESAADLVSAVQTMHRHLTSISDLAEAQKKTIFAARNVSMEFQQDVAEAAYHLGAMLKLPILDDALLAEILKTLSQTENILFMAHKAMETLDKTAHRLTALTRDVNTKGCGKLETLTEAIQELASRIHKEGHQKGEELLQSAEAVQTINSEFAELGAPRIMNAGVMLRRIPLTIRRLEMSNADLATIFSESLAETLATYNQIMLLTSDITFHTTIRTASSQICRELTAISTAQAGPLLPTLLDDCRSMAEEFHGLYALYTMDSERRIHAQLLGAMPAEEESCRMPEDNDDGFELF
ncbi:MAG: hypothetical protein G8237_11560 [Magnetococcales bacterium]|nr:hypothetical protein [Magnetococcales bacterium]NGZ06981.1 hypothetical protein [Magnetococcales bacterium]